MPNGRVRISADSANRAAARSLAERLQAEVSTDDADITVVSGPPDNSATHVVVTGELGDDIDEWDRDVAPQTVAGALWVAPGQDTALAVAAWWMLRSQTPTTPLSDLTDGNERCLRWSVVGVTTVDLADEIAAIEVDEAAIRSWLDEQPQVQALGTAIDRLGGDSGEAVLRSVEGLREAMADLDQLAEMPPAQSTPALDAAVAEHLRQVQRSGLSRWRSGKARAKSQADLTGEAKAAAAQRLREVIAARSERQREDLEVTAGQQADSRRRQRVQEALEAVELPITPDFGKVPRSWSEQAPDARRHVLVNDERADLLEGIERLRPSPLVLADEALCIVIQSGFSLPALRD